MLALVEKLWRPMAVVVALIVALGLASYYGPQQPQKEGDQDQGVQAIADKKENEPFDWTLGLIAFVGSQMDAVADFCASDADSKKDEWKQKFVCESSFPDVIIAVFTGFLVWIAWRLNGLNRTQIRTTEGELRAYLAPEDPKLFEFNAEKPAEAQITIRNFGNTPAYNVVTYIWLAPLTMPVDKEFNFIGPFDPERQKLAIKSPRSIPPSGKIKLPVGCAKPFPIDLLAKLADSSEVRLHMFGRVEYRDTFRRRRYTNFCFEWDRHALENPNLALVSTRHNDAS